MSDTPNNGRKLSLKRGTESTAGTPRLEERLHKVLAQAGLGSRRALEQRIADGRVKVNRAVAQTGMSICRGDRVEHDAKVMSEIGRASCRERGWKYGEHHVV